MVPYRPAPAQPFRLRLSQIQPNKVPSTPQIILNFTAMATSAAGAVLTFSSMSQKDSTLESVLKSIMGAGLVVVFGVTAMWGFRIE